MPRDGKLAESEAVTLLQSGWVLVVSELRRRGKPPNVKPFLVEPETEQEWRVEVLPTPVPWSGRWVRNQALGPRVPDQVVTELPRRAEDTREVRGGLRWNLWFLTLRTHQYIDRTRSGPSVLDAQRRIHWEQVSTPESEQKRNHERPLPAEEVLRRLARGHELLEVRYWRGGPRSNPQSGRRIWVQDPLTNDTARAPSECLRWSWQFRERERQGSRLRLQHVRRVHAGRAHWEVVASTCEALPDWLPAQRTLTDELGAPLPLGTTARVLAALEQIEERVSPAPDWIMA